MKKTGQYFALVLLLLSNVPVQAMALETDGIHEIETSDFSAVEESHEEYIEEQTASSGQIDNDQEPNENSDKESESENIGTEETVAEETVKVEESSENQMDKKNELPEKNLETAEEIGSYNFINSQVVNGVRYEWNWDSATRSLDFNANNGNSQDAIQVMRNNNLMGVQYLILRNLNEATSNFQTLTSLVTIEFYNVATITTEAFRDLTTLQKITFNDDINVQRRAFQGCTNLVTVNNSLAMTAILDDAFNGTAIEELEVGVAWASGLATRLSLNGMDSLRKLVNHGGGGLSGNFLGAVLPMLEVYEGVGDGATMFNDLVTFLNSMAPNLKVVRMSARASSTTYAFDKLDLRNVPYLEEFRYQHSATIGGEYTLGANAFEGLENLRTVQFDGITGISENTFRNTPNLEEVNINRVRTIGDYAFNNTPSLKIVSAPQLRNIGRSVFVHTGLEEIYFPRLEETGHYPFEGNEYLRKVDLPNLRLGGWQLFAYCPSLEEVNLPLLERINHADFIHTTSLEELYLPSAITFQGNQHFSESGVKILTLPKIDLTRAAANSFSGTNIDYLEAAYMNDANRLKEILATTEINSMQINEQSVFGDGYADLSDSMDTLEKVSLPKATFIGNGMFKNMTSLKEISAPLLVEIGNETFRNSGLTTIDFPALEKSGEFTFAETNSLISATLPKLSTLGHSVFYQSRVETVAIPEVRLLSDSTFELATRLTEVSMAKAEVIGYQAFGTTKSLRILNLPEVRELEENSFYNSGIEYLDLPKLSLLGERVFIGTENLRYLNMPRIQEITSIDGMFYFTGIPYGANIGLPTIHGIDTSMRNLSGIEVIMTLDENREVVKPLTENRNDRILAIATDGTEVIESDPEIHLEVGDRLELPVFSNLIINDSTDDVKADIDHVWVHNGNPMEYGNSLIFEEVMPWHNGIYYRHLSVNYSKNNNEIFSHDSNTVTLNIPYTNELGVTVTVDDPEITIGDSTTVRTTIENISGYGEVEVSIDLVNGLLGGIELVKNSISNVLNGEEESKNLDLSGTITIPQSGKLEITYEVMGVNNESIENNLQVILTEEGKEGETHIWAGANRLVVNNGRLRFTSQAPEIIEFNQWDNSNPLMLGSTTTQLNTFSLEVEDLRGSNNFAQNEIQGNRSNWRVEVITDNVFVDETGQESIGLLQLLAQTEDGNWHEAKNGVPMYNHVTNKELPLSSRYHSIDIGDGTQLGIMLNQLTGLLENSTYSVDMTFDLIDAP